MQKLRFSEKCHRFLFYGLRHLECYNAYAFISQDEAVRQFPESFFKKMVSFKTKEIFNFYNDAKTLISR